MTQDKRRAVGSIRQDIGPDAFARVIGWLGFGFREHRTATLINLVRPLAGWSFHGLLKPLQKSPSSVVKCLQNSILSAGSAGLVGRLDGHQSTIRKQGNVRQSHGELRHEQR